MRYFYSTGKRKTAVARVRLYENGSGKMTINGRPMESYFSTDHQSVYALSPLKLTEMQSAFDISVKVVGGGITGQAQAIRHGVARALTLADPLLRSRLKAAGFISRDSRIKERKKPGLKRARRAPQFSKR